jgi:hypothetical protein
MGRVFLCARIIYRGHRPTSQIEPGFKPPPWLLTGEPAAPSPSKLPWPHVLTRGHTPSGVKGTGIYHGCDLAVADKDDEQV